MRRTTPARPFALLLAMALAIPAAAAAQARNAREISYPPLPPFEIPQPERVVLDNGMVVLLLEDHELPLVDAIALVRAGSRLEPAEKTGLAALTGSVLRTGGSGRRTGDQLDDYLEGKAAVIESAADDSYVRISMSSLRQDFPEVLAVFADVLRRPAFEAAKLEVARTQALTRVARQNDNPQQILFREIQKVVYGPDSPYARTDTYASLRGIGREDLAAWHREHFHPDRVVLGLVGDFDRAQALRLVRAAFGDWPRGPAAGQAEAPYRKEPSPGVYYAEKNDVTQSSIAMGELGVLRNNPDYHAIEVMNQVLSGSFASRLLANIRTRKALAYSVWGEVGSDWDHHGLTLMAMNTKTQTTGAGIDALLEEARNMTAAPPSEQEVELAKQALLNSFVFRADSKREILSQILTFEYFGYPLDWLARYRQGIEAVSVEQVRQAAAKYLKPDRFAIVVVGPREGTDKPLSTYGTVTPLDITIPGSPGRQQPGQ